MIPRFATLAATLGLAFLATPASAQTSIAPLAPDPQAVALVDRVDALEGELRKSTAENERLQFQLRQAQSEIAQLKQKLSVYEPPTPDAPSAPFAAPPSGASLGASSGASSGAPLGASPNYSPAVSSGISAGPAPGALSSPQAGVPVSPALPVQPQDPASAFKSAYALVMNSDHVRAESALRTFLTTYGASEQAPEARYWLGQVLLAQGKTPEAAEQFLTVVRQSARSSKAPDSYVYLGMAFKQMGQLEQACAVFRDVPVKFPSAPQAIKQRAATQARACPA